MSSVIVIFGASGDLTERKLVPSLFKLHRKGRLPDDFHVVGVSRRPLDDEGFRKKMRDALSGPVDAESWSAFAPRLHYFPGDATRTELYGKLDGYLAALESAPAHRLYYLATAPELFPQAVENLGRSGMAEEREGESRRVVIEKPYGRDRASARELNRRVHQRLLESQVYRIDHYLGKETVQNLMVFRFSNAIFEPIWNRNYVDNIQITVAETVGVEHRKGYYDEAGVLRDMVQNHLLQLLCLVALEPPARFEPDQLRNEKVKVLEAIDPMGPDEAMRHVVLGQYRGYRERVGKPRSRTPTYAALRLSVDSWRWQGVPFYLRTGKKLKDKVSEVDIHFRRPPIGLLGLGDSRRVATNRLSICLQPDEGFHLRFDVKMPDQDRRVKAQNLEFHYKDAFGDIALPDAYERLLLDALNGDASLFTRSDEIDLSWELIDSVIAGWDRDEAPAMAEYAVGSWGPAEADQLLADDGRTWSLGCFEHD
jgi:glucose-6-phosphate 1-dehydrogenase